MGQECCFHWTVLAWMSHALQFDISQGCSQPKDIGLEICFQSGSLTWLSHCCWPENLRSSPCGPSHRATWISSQRVSWLPLEQGIQQVKVEAPRLLSLDSEITLFHFVHCYYFGHSLDSMCDGIMPGYKYRKWESGDHFRGWLPQISLQILVY